MQCHRWMRGGELLQQLLTTRKRFGREPSTALPWKKPQQQRLTRIIQRDSANHTTPKDSDPHGELRRLVDEHMLLTGKEPQQVTTSNLISKIAEQVRATPPRHQIQLELGMPVRTVLRGSVGVGPDATVQGWLEIQAL